MDDRDDSMISRIQRNAAKNMARKYLGGYVMGGGEHIPLPARDTGYDDRPDDPDPLSEADLDRLSDVVVDWVDE